MENNWEKGRRLGKELLEKQTRIRQIQDHLRDSGIEYLKLHPAVKKALASADLTDPSSVMSALAAGPEEDDLYDTRYDLTPPEA